MSLSPHRQLVEAFVARETYWQTRYRRLLWQPYPPEPWLDLGGAKRAKRCADVVLDLAGCPDVLGDAQRLPFCDNAFALVTAVEMLYLVADLEQCLREVRRVLRPGGRLVATCPFSHPSTEPGDWRRPTAHAWRWMLEHAGFETAAVEALGGPYSLMAQAAYVAATGGGQPDGRLRGLRRVLGAFTARTAPAGRWLDRRSGAAWPLGYGVVAVG